MSRFFNLIDEAWIPVRFSNGRYEELGIKATLLQASKIAAVEDQSPLVVASIHRLLLAVLYRALKGPADIEHAKELFKTGLPVEKIEGYLKNWHDRFWLFDDQYPFFQIPLLELKIRKAWTVLSAENNADNAKVLFDHVNVERPGTISPAAASRGLVATQTYSVGGGNTELLYTSGAPSATAAMVIPIGASLNDTLLFSLVPQNRNIVIADLPIWEREPETIPDLKDSNIAKRIPVGYADLYTWRIRSVLLQENEDKSIMKLAFASGVKCSPSQFPDPMLAYRIDEKNGKLPLQFKQKGLWREFDSLLPDNDGLAPLVVEHAIALTKTFPKRYPRSLMALGQANDKAKIEFWRMERFVFPKEMSGDKTTKSFIRDMLKEANDAQLALWKATHRYATCIISRGDRVPAKKDISDFVSQMPCTSLYWSVLEAKFNDALQSIRNGSDQDKIELAWLRQVKHALLESWNSHKASISLGDAWSIRALVKAEGSINEGVSAVDELLDEFATNRQKEGA